MARESGAAGNVLDLFSGCGGLSLGFHTAGFRVLGGVELDPLAARTHALNFHGGCERHGRPRSVSTDPLHLLAELGVPPDTQIDVLVGGPPCQAFARIGRAKLRAEAARGGKRREASAWLDDPRVSLYLDYLRFVEVLQPHAILMENVPDVLNHGGRNLMEEVCETLSTLGVGYDASYSLLNAAHFGVPQMRERTFLVAFRRDLGVGPVRMPCPTHSHRLPSGYLGTRMCALKPIRENGATHYQEAPVPPGELRRAVTARSALGDLPGLHAEQLLRSGALRRGARRLDEAAGYRTRTPRGRYAILMRRWPGFESPETTAHVIRYLPRDYPIFRRMQPGDQYPEAVAIARGRLEDLLRSRKRVSRKQRKQLEREMVPPYDPGKFPNKWRKMEPNAPSRTLMAHLGKDSYSHIHYDSEQARTISVREAARLQSFPDGFQIAGSMNAGFRQIGNAVPPLLAYALARQIGEQLGCDMPPDMRVALGFVEQPQTV